MRCSGFGPQRMNGVSHNDSSVENPPGRGIGRKYEATIIQSAKGDLAVSPMCLSTSFIRMAAVTTQLENEDLDGPTGDRSTKSARWAVRAFRVPITLAAVLLFNQSLQAGEFMSGRYEFLEFHMLGASVASVVVGLAVVGAAWARFRGRYPSWVVAVTAVLFVAIRLQMWAGEKRALSVHVPLGVSLIVAVILLTVWAWRES